MKSILNATTALVAAVSLLQPALLVPARADDDGPSVQTQPNPGPDHAPYFYDEHDSRWHRHDGDDDIAHLLREKIKYVFVIFNENHSFDNEYGTFPGVNGIYSDGRHPRPASATPGFTQTYTDLSGNPVTVQPFLLGPQQNSTFRDSVDHSHTGLARKIHVVNGVPQMDQFSLDEYLNHAVAGNPQKQAQGTQFARLVMSHIDCDTIPFFWRYASRFTIFDNIFATEDTPSTPNAIAMLAGQSGETQWVKHPSTDPAHPTATGTTAPFSGTVASYGGNGFPIAANVTSTNFSGTGTTQGPPIVNDPQPWWGSVFDTTVNNRQPNAPKEFWGPTNIASNLTFASVPLSLMGNWVTWYTNQDTNPSFDLPDIQQDIPFIQKQHQEPVVWHWYQNGYDHEPNDGAFPLPHTPYVSHHNGAQYFGYLANNPAERGNFRGEGDFFSDVQNRALPREGGVFYIRGGYYNLNYPSLVPPIQNPKYPNPAGLTATEIATIDITKSGDDDHPSYSDSQISEAMAAKVINAIASDREIWEHSAIIITYDESDGFWDHVPPRILSYGPDGLPLSRGVRIPMLLISPYARVHAVSHAEGDHNAVIETINAVFGRTPLSQLPDEAQALAAGNSPAFNQFGPAGFEQKYLGPRDTNSPITSSLLSGFDPARLRGEAPPLPASYAMIPDQIVNTFPHFGGNGCQAIGIVPEDKRQGIVNQIPPGFNSLPSTLPAYN
jgi:phospholipase C